MIMTLREAIYERVKGMDHDKLNEVIDGSIGEDEKALPGLGVLFEVIWENSDEELKKKMSGVLADHLPTTSTPS
jgi:small acid-soluble spore protein I (minor)